jgi:hypothetical protein
MWQNVQTIPAVLTDQTCRTKSIRLTLLRRYETITQKTMRRKDKIQKRIFQLKASF